MFRKGIYILIASLLSILLLESILRRITEDSFCQKIAKEEIHFYDPAPFELRKNGIFSHHKEIPQRLMVLKQKVHNLSLNQALGFVAQENTDISEKYLKMNFLNTIYQKKEERQVFLSTGNNHLWQEIADDNEERGYLKYITKIKETFKSDSQAFKAAIDTWIEYPINAEGFRSLAFEQYRTNRKSILLIGDSFTYGYTSCPLYKSFADQLLAEGYIVYNGGIPSAGTVNYYQIAEEYIPKLQPDYVFVMYNLGNDLTIFLPDDEEQYKPLHATNLGWLSTYINDRHHNDPEIWKSNFLKACNLKVKHRIFNRSALLRTINNRILNNHFCAPCQEEVPKDKAIQITNTFLRKINELGSLYGSRCAVFIIPDEQSLAIGGLDEEKQAVFEGVDYVLPNKFKFEDFRFSEKKTASDSHFNNEGHMKMKEIIHQWILEKE